MKNAVLKMLEKWLSNERLLSNSTPRFLTDDEESREQPSSVRQCSRLLLLSQVKSSHLYLYSAFNNTNCNKALHNIKIGKFCQ